MTGLLPILLSGWTEASAQSYLDRFAGHRSDAPERAASDAAEVADDALAYEQLVAQVQQLTEALRELEARLGAPAEEDVFAVVDASAAQLDEEVLLASVAPEEPDALAALPDLIELPAERLPVASDPARGGRRDRERPALTAGLMAGSAYVNRGLNVFGSRQSSLAAVLAPSLGLGAEGWSVRWTGAFQATGDRRDDVVRSGDGHEQNVFGLGSVPLAERTRLEVGLRATAYPFASAERAGATAPMYLEPAIGLAIEREVTVRLALAHSQWMQRALAPESYSYLSAGLSYAAALRDHTEIVLGAAAGAKRWVVGPQGRANTYDIDLSWGVQEAGERLRIRPVGHLTWTNLPGLSAGGETFAWLGIDTALGL